jgi:hypothetical protein
MLGNWVKKNIKKKSYLIILQLAWFAGKGYNVFPSLQIAPDLSLLSNHNKLLSERL